MSILLSVVGITVGMNRESFWGLMFLTILVDASLVHFFL